MKCEHCLEYLVAYITNDLSDDDFTQIKSHLEHCHSCSSEVNTMSSLWRDLDKQIEQHPEPQMQKRFNQMLSKEIDTCSRMRSSSNTIKIKNLFLQLWPNRPAWAISYSFFLLFSGVLIGHAFPQAQISSLQNNLSANYFDINNIPEERLIQLCSTQNSQSYQTL